MTASTRISRSSAVYRIAYGNCVQRRRRTDGTTSVAARGCSRIAAVQRSISIRIAEAESGLFDFVVRRGVVEFALSQLVERDDHKSQARTSVAEHVSRRPARQGSMVESVGSARGLVRPNSRVFFRRQLLKTFQQPSGESGSRVWL
jgi:hypothetical protein